MINNERPIHAEGKLILPIDEEDAVLKECISNLTIRHRQYGKKQNSWVRNRILNRTAPVLELDTSNCTTIQASAENWKKQVLEPAKNFLDGFFQQKRIRGKIKKRAQIIASRLLSQALSLEKSKSMRWTLRHLFFGFVRDNIGKKLKLFGKLLFLEPKIFLSKKEKNLPR